MDDFATTAGYALRYWEQLDCPTSLGLCIAARYKDWATVITHTVSPNDFEDPLEFKLANAAVGFLKKNPDIPGTSAETRKSAARKSFEKGESECYHANERLARFIVSPLAVDAPSQFLQRVRAKVISWLGRPPGDDEVKRRARHGPGSTFSSLVRDPTAADKYDDWMSLTPNAVYHLANLVGTKWGQLAGSRYVNSARDCVKFIRGGRHTTVPKSALTDRNILVEPSVNVYFQLAYGSALRSRLRASTGWDLDNAAAVHREMARSASSSGAFATLDLSNASDTMCKNLVRVLLRKTGWLEPLEELRSSHALIDGRWRLLEKFSSMGNGYTFELETIVFAAICSVLLEIKGEAGVLGYDLFVFGDDIIVPTGCASIVTKTLSWLGFSLNAEKSYASGPFRESCGADFFYGVPVRAAYCKERLGPDVSTKVRVYNRVRRLGLPRLEPFLRDILHTVPSQHRLGGDERLGDTVFHGIPERFRWQDGIRWVRTLRFSRPTTIGWQYFSVESRLACRLTGHGHTHGIDSRGAIRVLEHAWVSGS